MGGGIQLVLPQAAQAANAKVVIKLDWLMSNGQIGDVMAVNQGYFSEAGLDAEFTSLAILLFLVVVAVERLVLRYEQH